MSEMAGRLLIRGGRVVDPGSGRDEQADLLIEGGVVAALERPGVLPEDGTDTIDATGLVVAPGLIDMHVHLREPGYEYRETVYTGCRSAVAGGVTSVACMANTNPVNDNASVTGLILEKSREAALANVFPIGAVSVALEGKKMAKFGEMYEAGIVAVSDDGHPVMDSALMRRALEYSRMFGFPVIAHEEDAYLSCSGVINEGFTSVKLGLKGIPGAAESAMVARDIEILRLTGGHLHVAHVSTAEAVEMVRNAKRARLRVTAEVTPHHFTLDESVVEGFKTNAKMNPPLRNRRDVEAVREGLADGTIDTIATDHAPHHRDEKDSEMDRAPFGIVGLETLLPLSLALVRDGAVSLPCALAAMTVAPAANLGLDRGTLLLGAVADVTVFDPDLEWRFDASLAESKSSNSPFDGWPMCGRAIHTIVGGRRVWENPR